VKKMPERAPEPPESAQIFGRIGCAHCRGHRSILT
jgi:hypothetical protein